MALARQSAQGVARYELRGYRGDVTETDPDTEQGTALRNAQAAYLASRDAQDARRAEVLKAFQVSRWPIRRIAREMGVAPGTVNAIIAAAARTDR